METLRRYKEIHFYPQKNDCNLVIINVFDKPDEQSDTCFDSAHSEKRWDEIQQNMKYTRSFL